MTIEWLAGFFDGEGCVTILRTKVNRASHYTPSVTFTNTNLLVLQEIQKSFGGTIHSRRHNNPKWNIAYSLVFSGSGEARRILELMQPHLILKKPEVDFFLTEWNTEVRGRQRQMVSKEILSQRESIAQQLSSMKSRNNIPTLEKIN